MNDHFSVHGGRITIGFDIRKFACRHKLSMTSYDESCRNEDLIEDHPEEISALNLFKRDPSTIQGLIIPKHALIIAFDAAAQTVAHMKKGNVSVPPSIASGNLTLPWVLAGFDLVDLYTQLSAFDLIGDCAEFPDDELLAKLLEKNQYGLIANFFLAQKIARRLDDVFFEHKPFTSVGVWLKEISNGNAGT